MKPCKRCGGTERNGQGACVPCQNAAHKRWRERNKSKIAGWNKRYVDGNATKVAERQRKYRESNDFVIKLKDLNWRLSNPDRAKERSRRWAQENRDKVANYVRSYHARRVGRIPDWANRFFIEQAYDIAKVRSDVTGVKWTVDHIVPLQSKVVCGLHVEQNLQVVTSKENSSKGNRWWPDMWA